MQYNYSFEAASLLFMLLIFVHFMVVWQFPTEKTRVFRALLIVCIGESAFNILSSIGLANAGDRKSTRLNSSHMPKSRMPSSA